MSEFAKNFKTLREARHLSQTQLADRLKMSKSAISMYENERRELKFEDLIMIANFFNVDASYLIGSRNQVDLAKSYSNTAARGPFIADGYIVLKIAV